MGRQSLRLGKLGSREELGTFFDQIRRKEEGEETNLIDTTTIKDHEFVDRLIKD